MIKKITRFIPKPADTYKKSKDVCYSFTSSQLQPHGKYISLFCILVKQKLVEFLFGTQKGQGVYFSYMLQV